MKKNDATKKTKCTFSYNSLNPLNFLEGPHIDPDYLVGITPKDTRGDFENFISRIEKMPKQVFNILNYLNKIAQNTDKQLQPL